MIKWFKTLFDRGIIGYAVLKPWQDKRFASRKMVPRYDANGNIYMLLCVED